MSTEISGGLLFFGSGKKGTSSRRDKRSWVEKYRPRSVSDIVAQNEVVLTMKRTLETGELPHLLFHGTPGTGKTSTILAVARQLFGPELSRSRVLELNASDERGISVIRHKVKEFAMGSATSQTCQGHPVPAYKIVILDEADSMTPDAQNALRRTLEVYSHTTRFCLICNFVSRIIDPLISRCTKFRFKPLPKDAVILRLKQIADSEGLSLADGAFQAIADVSGEDLRKAITYLQSLYISYGNSITPHDVMNMAGIIPEEVLLDFLKACRSSTMQNLQKSAQELIGRGYSVDQALLQLFEIVKNSPDLDDIQKAKMMECMGEADWRLQSGADEYLQLMAVGAQLMRSIPASTH